MLAVLMGTVSLVAIGCTDTVEDETTSPAATSAVETEEVMEKDGDAMMEEEVMEKEETL